MKLDVFFDYSCPFCYIGLAYLEKALEQYPQLQLVWRPCEAHPRPEERVQMHEKALYWKKLLVKAQELDMPLVMPPEALPYTDLAIQGMYGVQALGGDLWAYHKAVYAAVYGSYRDIMAPETLLDCAKDTGISLPELEKALGEGTYAQDLLDGNAYAWNDMGFKAVPTFVLENGRRLEARPGVGITYEGLADFLAAHARA